VLECQNQKREIPEGEGKYSSRLLSLLEGSSAGMSAKREIPEGEGKHSSGLLSFLVRGVECWNVRRERYQRGRENTAVDCSLS